MKPQYILPMVTGSFAVGAGIIYLATGDWRRGGYWLCAAVITFFVTV